MDLLAVDGRDEGQVQQAVDLGGHAVSGMFGMVNLVGVLLAQQSGQRSSRSSA